MDREKGMRCALEEAKGAGEDVPVGCVIEYKGRIIASAHNQRETGEPHAVFAHAEMLCMLRAAQALSSRRLSGCRMYVTLEPCPMCAGAMILSGIDECIFGAYDPAQGACGSVYDLPEDRRFYHTVPCTGGVMEKECAALLRDFFRRRRDKKGEDGSVRPDPDGKTGESAKENF